MVTVKEVKTKGELRKFVDFPNKLYKDCKEYMFPAVDEFLVSTDIDKKEIRIKVIEGMFSED